MTHSVANRVGVCSWSLGPNSAADLCARAMSVGLSSIQLALGPIRAAQPGWGEIETINALRRAGITVLSGMMGMSGEDYSTLDTIARTGGVYPDATWGHNLRAAEDTAKLARRLGISLVTFHAGFIPHDPGVERTTMIGRLRTLADRFDDHGVRIAFETGQESADTLLHALDELNRPHVGVNFDPANMILYGMGDPIAALRALSPRVVQIHIKDAAPTKLPGTWGQELCAGKGAVDWKAFFAAVKELGLAADLLIEREGGLSADAPERRADIAAARDLLDRHGFGTNSNGGPWHE